MTDYPIVAEGAYNYQFAGHIVHVCSRWRPKILENPLRQLSPNLSIDNFLLAWQKRVKSCYNPLRLGTVIALVSSGINFVNTPARLPIWPLWFVPERAQSAWTLQETHRNSANYARDETRTSERLLDRQTP